MSSLGPSWRHLCPIQTLQLPAKPPLQAQGEGVGGGVNPSPKGKKGVEQNGLPKPLTPRGLVGFTVACDATNHLSALVVMSKSTVCMHVLAMDVSIPMHVGGLALVCATCVFVSMDGSILCHNLSHG